MPTATTTRTAARVTDAVKVYGAGHTAVRALDGATAAFPAGRHPHPRRPRAHP